jgi:hypothetical protein
MSPANVVDSFHALPEEGRQWFASTSCLSGAAEANGAFEAVQIARTF